MVIIVFCWCRICHSFLTKYASNRTSILLFFYFLFLSIISIFSPIVLDCSLFGSAHGMSGKIIVGLIKVNPISLCYWTINWY